MKMKIVDMPAHVLNWAMAMALSREIEIVGPARIIAVDKPATALAYPKGRSLPFRFTEQWQEVGPLIEAMALTVQFWSSTNTWAVGDMKGIVATGPTPLVAACRCIVMAKLGDELDVPDELMVLEAA